MQRQVLTRLGVILLLAVLPFFLFVGSTSRVVRNGVVMMDQRLNYLGIALAVTGLVLAVSMIVRRSLSDRLDASPTPLAARLAAAALALLCAGQIALSADVVRIEELWP